MKTIAKWLREIANREECRATVQDKIADRFARLGHHEAQSFHLHNAYVHRRNASILRRVAKWID